MNQKIFPTPVTERAPLERRLGIKSSLPSPNQLLSTIILFWIAENYPDELAYADPSSDQHATLKIKQDLAFNLEKLFTNNGLAIPSELSEIIEKSPLFTSQIEPLQVALELVWKLGTLEFIDSKLTASSERTGGIRYLKRINFSANLDLLKESFNLENPESRQNFLKTLLHWIDNSQENNKDVEQRLLKVLTILSENTYMKTGQEENEIIFQQAGIYENLLTHPEIGEVGLAGEHKGPLRVILSFIRKKLHPILNYSNNSFKLNDRENLDSLKKYLNRVKVLNELTEPIPDFSKENVNTPVENKKEVRKLKDHIPHNWLIFGAPGTGKSFFLSNLVKEQKVDVLNRVTFYPDYTYFQFVGGYKPTQIYKSNSQNDFVNIDGSEINRPGHPIIEYQFVPGPMLSILINAIKNPSKTFVLIIEEINRADAASVFGDFFQLLDRDVEGKSQYVIDLSPEAKQYVTSVGLQHNEIYLPENLYIWATMNNADQGVSPLDTAFRRRWQYHYISINKNSHIIRDRKIKTKFKDIDGNPLVLNWDVLRNKINTSLSDLGIHEDLLIGPFFLSKQELLDDRSFQFKLLGYLKDDVLRHQASDFFTVKSGNLSDILEQYEKGKNIFNFSLTDD